MQAGVSGCKRVQAGASGSLRVLMDLLIIIEAGGASGCLGVLAGAYRCLQVLTGALDYYLYTTFVNF